MSWSQLLSKKRIDGNGDFVEKDGERPAGKRSEFEKDFDRIAYSPSFRRLQNKTQVHTLPNNDHVRNRLTHSLEASTLARSLGLRIGQWLEAKGVGVSPHDVASCVQAATLAHDIGNPPFGHSGEEAIRRWCERADKETPLDLTPLEKQDFLSFNGNAQGFRVLARFRNGRQRPGLHLTCGVLGAFLKYPRSPTPDNRRRKGSGLFHQDAKLYRTIAAELGIPKLSTAEAEWARHPLAFLLEAADDAAYLTADIEDGVELGIVPFQTATSLFGAFLEGADKVDFSSDYSVLAKYRSKTIGKLLKLAIAEFKSNYPAIMLGAHSRPLLDPTKYERVKALREEAFQSLFSSAAQIRREFAGQKALEGLLRHFALTICVLRDADWNMEKLREKNKEAWRLLKLTQGPCAESKGALLGTELPRTDYDMLHYITDFIAGQTDRYAVDLWKKLRGVEL